MGEIDRLYRYERDQAMMLRNEVERLRSSNEGWSRAVDQADAALRSERKLADYLATAIHDYLADEYGESDAGELSYPPAGAGLAAAWDRYREVRDR